MYIIFDCFYFITAHYLKHLKEQKYFSENVNLILA